MRIALPCTLLLVIGMFAGCGQSHTAQSLVTLQPQERAILELGPAVERVSLENRGPGTLEVSLRDFRNRIHTTLTLGAPGSYEFRTSSTGRAEFSNLSDEAASLLLRLEGDEGLDFSLRQDGGSAGSGGD